MLPSDPVAVVFFYAKAGDKLSKGLIYPGGASRLDPFLGLATLCVETNFILIFLSIYLLLYYSRAYYNY